VHPFPNFAALGCTGLNYFFLERVFDTEEVLIVYSHANKTNVYMNDVGVHFAMMTLYLLSDMREHTSTDPKRICPLSVYAIKQ